MTELERLRMALDWIDAHGNDEDSRVAAAALAGTWEPPGCCNGHGLEARRHDPLADAYRIMDETALTVPFDRIVPIDGPEVEVGMILVDADYIPYDGVGAVTAVERGTFVHRVSLRCLADNTIVDATINMKERVFIGRLADVVLRGAVTYETIMDAIDPQ